MKPSGGQNNFSARRINADGKDGSHLPMLVRKSFSSRVNAFSRLSWFFQLEKSGM